ncbi:conserved hypothetical protein [Rubrobacter xylanophilus DSM 9941]|uniref:Sulfotransferase n=1 Tax=Rubrobacter xylanophilus (strain DSM 9941 / JCM 11954 / NBRC 16129 / PRD-1) TaxID=266117 RepID=Q1AYJ2_RUBXD|nr:sulfotransferase [Rubrobacter xylanophilus]ABG03536.1 conserved hypothetical protein [Rubrobacter xylanophilus DSM 9941]
MNPKIIVLFIGAWGRSGSTLLERMLGQMPRFFAVGELRHVWDRSFQDNQLCGCGKSFYSCEFWRAVGSEAFGGLERVDVDKILTLKATVDRYRYMPCHIRASKTGKYNRRMADAVKEYASLLERFYRAIQAVSGAEVIVDSSKDPPYAFLLNALPFVDLRLIHLVRDSRAVAYSWSRERERPEITDRLELMPRFGPVMSSYGWNLYNYSLGFLRRFVPSSALLRYEDLVQGPDTQVRRVLEETGFDQPLALPFVHGRKVRLGTNHTVSGNPMRFQTGMLDLRPDEEWKTKMRRTDKYVATVLTAPLLLRYRYLSSKRIR